MAKTETKKRLRLINVVNGVPEKTDLSAFDVLVVDRERQIITKASENKVQTIRPYQDKCSVRKEVKKINYSFDRQSLIPYSSSIFPKSEEN